MLSYLEEKALMCFGNIATIRASSHEVQIDFTHPQCDIDLVYKTNYDFDLEYKEIEEDLYRILEI